MPFLTNFSYCIILVLLFANLLTQKVKKYADCVIRILSKPVNNYTQIRNR